MHAKEHWEKIHSANAPDSVSWYQAHADLSLRMIRSTGISVSAAIVDVGGGASTLVDDLLLAGYTNLSVLDLSASALNKARRRLGAAAEMVNWVEADVTTASLAVNAFDLWHDRAVFHFLTAPEGRAAYVASVLRSVNLGGHVIVATFAEDGPTRCSGLPVIRYRADELHAEFGKPFSLVSQEREVHRTPAGAEQKFVYCRFRRNGS